MGFGSTYTQLYPPKATLTEDNVTSQNGKVFIVTGGNNGVGFELCKILYKTGAKIYMATRSEIRATAAIQAITAQPRPATAGSIEFLHLDLNDLQSVKAAASAFAAKETKLDVLWNNAGLGGFRVELGEKTIQGFEPMIGVHCIATLLFTQLLEPLLAAGAAASTTPGSTRVVWTSSIAAESAPPNGVEFDLLDQGTSDRTRNYAVSKVGGWMLGAEMARRWGSKGIVSVVQNPGNIKGGSYGGMNVVLMMVINRLLKETRFGAHTELYAGLSSDITLEKNGAYIIPWGRIRPDSENPRQDLVKAMLPEEEGGLGYGKKLWEWSSSGLGGPLAFPTSRPRGTGFLQRGPRWGSATTRRYGIVARARAQSPKLIELILVALVSGRPPRPLSRRSALDVALAAVKDTQRPLRCKPQAHVDIPSSSLMPGCGKWPQTCRPVGSI
ncbi:hypothetical protein G7046_g8806 [Stylonectria norvegica]|nr:hypothetical protein G7046_g8806 [Stylonectria norvegica]